MTTTTNEINQKQSLVVVRNTLRTAFSTVAFLRGICPSECFQEKPFAGLMLHAFRGDREDSGVINDWIERGAFDALEKGFLREVALCVYTPDSSRLLESYTFRVSYDPLGHAFVELSSQSQLAVNSQLRQASSRFTREGVSKKIQELALTLIAMVEALPPLEADRLVTMRIGYYDERTPADYEPPFFAPASDRIVKLYNEELAQDAATPSAAGSCGSVATRYHTISFVVRRPPPPPPPTSHELQMTQNSCGELEPRQQRQQQGDRRPCSLLELLESTALMSAASAAPIFGSQRTQDLILAAVAVLTSADTAAATMRRSRLMALCPFIESTADAGAMLARLEEEGVFVAAGNGELAVADQGSEAARRLLREVAANRWCAEVLLSPNELRAVCDVLEAMEGAAAAADRSSRCSQQQRREEDEEGAAVVRRGAGRISCANKVAGKKRIRLLRRVAANGSCSPAIWQQRRWIGHPYSYGGAIIAWRLPHRADDTDFTDEMRKMKFYNTKGRDQWDYNKIDETLSNYSEFRNANRPEFDGPREDNSTINTGDLHTPKHLKRLYEHFDKYTKPGTNPKFEALMAVGEQWSADEFYYPGEKWQRNKPSFRSVPKELLNKTTYYFGSPFFEKFQQQMVLQRQRSWCPRWPPPGFKVPKLQCKKEFEFGVEDPGVVGEVERFFWFKSWEIHNVRYNFGSVMAVLGLLALMYYIATIQLTTTMWRMVHSNMWYPGRVWLRTRGEILNPDDPKDVFWWQVPQEQLGMYALLWYQQKIKFKYNVEIKARDEREAAEAYMREQALAAAAAATAAAS